MALATTRARLFASLLLATLASGAATTALAAPDPAQTSGGAGAIVYPVEFFASAQPNTAMDMIQRVPGFSFDGGSNVRGFAGAVGNVVIDGAPPTSKSDSLEDVLRRIPASAVERIELVRGGAGGVDMHGHSVIANVVRKTGAAKTLLIGLADEFHQNGKTAPALRVEGSIRQGGRQVDGSMLLYQYVDNGAGSGPRVRRDGSGNVIQNAFQAQQGGGSGIQLKGGAQSPLGGGDLRLNADYTYEPYWFTIDDNDPISGVHFLTHDDYSRSEGEAGAHWERKIPSLFGGGLGVEGLALQRLKHEDLTSEFRVPGDIARFAELDDSGESIARTVLRWSRSPKLSIEGGGEAVFNFLEAKESFVENGAPVPLPADHVRVEEKRGEAFAQATWRVGPTLSLELGSKFETSTLTVSGDASSQHSFFYPKPRVLLTWSPGANDQVRFRFEREVGQLDFKTFAASTTFATGTVQAGNPDLHPDQTWTVEGAIEHRFWGKGAAVLSLRHKTITDVVDRITIIDPGCSSTPGNPLFQPGCPVGGRPPGAFDAPGNIGDGWANELQTDLTLPLDRLGIKGGLLRGSATLRNSEVTDPTTHTTRRISNQHAQDRELHFSQDLARQKATWGINYFGGFREASFLFNEVRTVKGQPWLDVFYEYKPKPGLAILFQANNLLTRGFTREREVWTGLRDASPVSFQERRPLPYRPYLYVRVRKTFG